MSTLPPARVRFAPSPTGRLHIGSGRTALYNYLLARQTGGQFILRLEDTDQKRYVPGSEDEIRQGLRWLGLEWDEGFDIGGPYGPYRQSLRKEMYQELGRQLVDAGHGYYCFCTPDRLEQVRQGQIKLKQTPHYDGACRNLDIDEARRRVAAGERHVVRFKMPQDGAITVRDHLRGEMTFENRTLDDSILIKSDGLALYHLASMADDYFMKTTHVIRSSEWLPTFPLHMHVINAFGWPAPDFLHLSLFLKPNGKGKMSKRDSAALAQDGHSVFITDLEKLGYLPEAVVNWVALMGWSYDDHTEFFTMDDLIEKFSLDKLNPAPAAVNFTKFDHFNGLHIRRLDPADLARRVKPFLVEAGYPVDDGVLVEVTPLIQERLVTLDEAPAWLGFFFQDQVNPAPEDLVGAKLSAADSAAALRRACDILSALPDISLETAEPPMRLLAEDLGLSAGQLFGILRSAVTGQKVSPPLFESMAVIGRAKVLERLQNGIRLLDGI